jgi:glutamate-1-semialdehyde 2,1-aminomutase
MRAYGNLGVERSAQLADRLLQSFPGGNTRTTTFYEPLPLALRRGAGYRVWDVDGNEFIDLLNNYTALVHGHAHPDLVAALQASIAEGGPFPAATSQQAELGETMCARYGLDRVRFTNSGTEAVLMAVRVARAFTGRDLVVKARGGYHGGWEQLSLASSAYDVTDAVARGSAGQNADGARSRFGDNGIPDAVRGLVRMIDYNDPNSLEQMMAADGAGVAAVILEPVIGEGAIPASPEFAKAARGCCDRHGALLIWDEVATARLGFGGAQEQLGVPPDLTTFGKIIGGGIPIGAFGGRAEVMALFDPRRADHLPHQGTFNGHAWAMAAGLISLRLLSRDEIERINGLGNDLRLQLAPTLHAVDPLFTVSGVGSIAHVGHPDPAMQAALHRAGLRAGLYFAPRGLMTISTPMDRFTIDEVAGRMEAAASYVSAAQSDEGIPADMSGPV